MWHQTRPCLLLASLSGNCGFPLNALWIFGQHPIPSVIWRDLHNRIVLNFLISCQSLWILPINVSTIHIIQELTLKLLHFRQTEKWCRLASISHTFCPLEMAISQESYQTKNCLPETFPGRDTAWVLMGAWWWRQTTKSHLNIYTACVGNINFPPSTVSYSLHRQ